MRSLLEQVEDISRISGLTMKIEGTLDVSDLKLSRSDQRNTVIANGNILDFAVVFFRYDGNLELRQLPIYSKIRNAFPDKHVVIVTELLSAVEKKAYVNEGISFVASNGEMFIPFVGARLFPSRFSLVQQLNKDLFTPAEQRLALMIVLVQLIFEQRNDAWRIKELKNFSIDGDKLIITGGKAFVDSIGSKVGINTRVTFNRAANSLVNRDLLNYSGETRNRFYSCTMGSQRYFQKIEDFLTFPIQESGKLILSKFPRDNIGVSPLKSGITALSMVTMINDNERTKSYIVDRKEQESLQYWAESIGMEDQEPHNLIQVSKYDLKGFNWLFRLVADYPLDVIDPFHLYIQFKNVVDDRIRGEVEDLLDRVWMED